MQAFMKTWVAACQHRGKARVFIPEGVFKLGPVTFAGPCSAISPIIVDVSGTLKADTDISLYDNGVWFSFEDINGIVLTGTGNFDGQGHEAWQYNDCTSNSDCVQLPAVTFSHHHEFVIVIFICNLYKKKIQLAI